MTALVSLLEAAYRANDAADAARAALASLLAQEAEYLALCDDLPRDLAVAIGDAEAIVAQAAEVARVAWEAEAEEYDREYPHGYGYYKWCERQREAEEWDRELAERC